jgi:hypothetical protein
VSSAVNSTVISGDSVVGPVFAPDVGLAVSTFAAAEVRTGSALPALSVEK